MFRSHVVRGGMTDIGDLAAETKCFVIHKREPTAYFEYDIGTIPAITVATEPGT